MHFIGGGEVMSTMTQQRSKPYPLCDRSRSGWMSRSVTFCKRPLAPPSLVQGEVRGNSITKLGNGELTVYVS